MRRPARKYSYLFGAHVNSFLPEDVIDALERHGWNMFGVYEVVRDERRKWKRKKKPVFQDEVRP